jgi:hypothetical protein
MEEVASLDWSDYLFYGGLIAAVAIIARRLFAPPKPVGKLHDSLVCIHRLTYVAVPPKPKRQSIGKRDFTLAELRKYDGTDPTLPILLVSMVYHNNCIYPYSRG